MHTLPPPHGLTNFVTGHRIKLSEDAMANMTLAEALQFVPQIPYAWALIRANVAAGRTPQQALATALITLREKLEAQKEPKK